MTLHSLHAVLRALAAGLLFALCPPALHAQTTPAPPPQTTWYLAEGATGSLFEEDILIGNPNAEAADIRITFLRSGGLSPVVSDFTMLASSRRTVRVNEVPGLANEIAVSAVVTSRNGVPIVVERTMYWANQTKRGGHTAPAVSAPATRWYLAEGATGQFDTFVLIANPDAAKPAEVKVTFLTHGGATVEFPPFTIPPSVRANIWVNVEVPALANAPFSTIVESTNGTPVFVERAMYFGRPTPTAPWEGGHGTVAVTAPARDWFFGEGYTTDTPSIGFDTFLLLANPGTTPADVTVDFLLEDAPPIQKRYPLLPTSRENVWVDLIPDRDGILGKGPFSMRVRSDVPIIAERAMYWGPQVNGANAWVEAHNTAGVTADAPKWAFAEGIEDGVDPSGLQYETYFLVANTSNTALDLRTTFVREDGTGIVRTFSGIPANSRFTLPAGWFPELSNQRFAAFFESTNTVEFVAERAMYWGAGWYGGSGATGTPWTGTVATPPAPPAPAVTSVTPNQGFTTGGTLVTIAGTNFRAGSTVRIGGTPATSVQVLNATTIRAVTPARNAAGPVDVVITAGDVTATRTGGFTYVQPPPVTITGILPAIGTIAGGTEVTITGTNLGSTSQVTFGGTPATALISVTATQVRVRTPARAAGMVDVVVQTAEGLTATAPTQFEFANLLATDRILAFGDSNTEGVIAYNCQWLILPTSPTPTSLQCDWTLDGGYPSRLQGTLRAAYQPQTITVTNAGFGGELTGTGRNRLPTAMTAAHDLVIVMEGVNDINAGVPHSTIISNLRTMVRAAKSAGKAVMLGTVLPVVTVIVDGLPYTKSDNASIDALNARIRTLASEEAVILVDFNASFRASSNIDALFSGDGLHPSAEGYRRMANLLHDLIVANFGNKPPIVP